MNIKVTGVDYAPDDLYGQTPFTAQILRQLPGPDRQDYWLAELATPLKWQHDGSESLVTHLVVAARWVGGVIAPGAHYLPINIAYVTDQSLLSDTHLDFAKSHYCAIGVADVSP
jgi:hypothetical protein